MTWRISSRWSTDAKISLPTVNQAPAKLRDYLITAMRALRAVPAFDEALPGHLPPDEASQRRLPNLRGKLRAMAELG